ncbi:MAG: zinc ribbon domain-containing protein [Dehalococcoidia bacterium]
MMPPNPSYKCSQCGHEFEGADEAQLRCPKCGSDKLEENRFLFGTESAEGLTVDDYREALLAPCCGDARNLSNCPLWSEAKPKEATEK